MSHGAGHRYRAGDSLQDLCRACKAVRGHSIIVVDLAGAPLRVICDYCGSQHNYRGGEIREPSPRKPPEQRSVEPPGLVSERERRHQLSDLAGKENEAVDIELLLRRVIREETGLTPVPIAEKWRGGEMILRPGRPGLQEKGWPIETFFHKVVMLRNRLRVLEQQINGMDMPEDQKLRLQGYITGCYGSLTSFNILFAEEDDCFHGTSGSE